MKNLYNERLGTEETVIDHIIIFFTVNQFIVFTFKLIVEAMNRHEKEQAIRTYNYLINLSAAINSNFPKHSIRFANQSVEELTVEARQDSTADKIIFASSVALGTVAAAIVNKFKNQNV